jgi:hypothetical protein
MTGHPPGTSKAEIQEIRLLLAGGSFCSNDQYDVSLIYRVAVQSMVWCRVSVGVRWLLGVDTGDE